MSVFRHRLIMQYKTKPAPVDSYNIVFNGAWTPTEKFNDVFELLDANGTPIASATAQTTSYRFKAGKENYTGNTSLEFMFSSCTSLLSITLPATWGNVTSTHSMFLNCSALTNAILPATWGNVTNISTMFRNCNKLLSITLPATWANVTNTSNLFFYSPNLTSITLPATWANVTDTRWMFDWTKFTERAVGIVNEDSSVSSPSDGSFPAQAWKLGIGLDDIPLAA